MMSLNLVVSVERSSGFAKICMHVSLLSAVFPPLVVELEISVLFHSDATDASTSCTEVHNFYSSTLLIISLSLCVM